MLREFCTSNRPLEWNQNRINHVLTQWDVWFLCIQFQACLTLLVLAGQAIPHRPTLLMRVFLTLSFPLFNSFYRVLSQQTKIDRKSTRLNSSHVRISYAVFCLKKKRATGSNRC